MKTQRTFLVLAAVLAGTSVYADKVTMQQAPPAVQQAIRARAASRQIEDIDRSVLNGQTTYEASWKDNAGQQQELLVTETGQVMRDVPHNKKNRGRAMAMPSVPGFTNAQTAPLNWASETVQNKFKAMANGSEVQNFQKGQFQGKNAFEGSYLTNGNNVTVVLGEDGTLLASSNGGVVGSLSTATVAPATRSNGSIRGFTGAQAAPMNWASETVQNKFKQMANGAEVQNFQKGQFRGRPAFLGTYTVNGQPTTVIIGEDGSVLNTIPNAVGAPATTQSGTQ
jgi:hypothetical protein